MSGVSTVTVRLAGSKALKHAVAIDCSSEDLIGELKRVLALREECRYPSDELVFFVQGLEKEELHNETPLSSLLPVDRAVTLISIQVEPVGRMTLAQELDLDGANLFGEDGSSPKHSSKDSSSKDSFGDDDLDEDPAVVHGRKATILHGGSDSTTLDHVILDEETAVGHSTMDSDSMERSPLIRMGSEVASQFRSTNEGGFSHPTDPHLSQVWEEEVSEQRAHRESIELDEAGDTAVKTMVLTEEALAVMNGTSSRNVTELATQRVSQVSAKSSEDAADMPSMLAAISGKEALSLQIGRESDSIGVIGAAGQQIGYDEQMRQLKGLNQSMQVIPSQSGSDLKKMGSPGVPMAGVVDGSLSRSVMSLNSAGKSHSSSDRSRERVQAEAEQFKWTLVYVGAGFAAAVLIGAAVMIYRARKGGASSTTRRLSPGSEVRDYASVQRPRRKHVS